MAYYIRSLAWKKSAPHWKVQFLSYKKEDVSNSKAKKPKKEWDVPKERWRSLGFHFSMTTDEARARARQLNAQSILKIQEQRIRQLELDRAQERLRQTAVIPDEFLTEFELRFIRARDSETVQGLRKTTRAMVIWRAALKMILSMQVEPSEWFYSTHDFYDYLCQKQYSIRYANAILSMANLWGFYYSRKLVRPFLAIPKPRGYERQRILDSYYKKTENARRASEPLTPEHLQKVSVRMNQPNFNWLYLSVWLGLRPQEIDNLHRKEFWSMETLPDGRQILWIFQTKIVALPPEDRWKPIPLLFDEQKFAFRILLSGNFRRPIVRTVHNYFGSRINLYGGRKGFSDLMISKGQILENISIWMGHSTLDRTWRNYKHKRRFHLP